MNKVTDSAPLFPMLATLQEEIEAGDFHGNEIVLIEKIRRHIRKTERQELTIDHYQGVRFGYFQSVFRILNRIEQDKNPDVDTEAVQSLLMSVTELAIRSGISLEAVSEDIIADLISNYDENINN